jgi:signal transduction histidine kinase
MVEKLRVLIAEDNERDAAMLVRELRRGSYDLTFECIETPEAMGAALADRPWDLVVSDFSMPRFSAQAALALVKERGLDLPFIIVSGTVGEEAAVEAMRSGAHDFMPKGHFSRLLPAVAREMREAAVRREHRAIEQQLRQAQKMEAIGHLTGGIAHDFNNLLGVIVGNLDLLVESLQDDSDRIELASAALNSALRGAKLTRRLLAFARQQPLSTRIVDLNELLPDFLVVLRRTLGERIRLATIFADGLWRAEVDPSQIEDALLNLAINARDAMPDGGDITIETANMELDGNYALLHAGAVPGDYVALSVTDTGSGMTPEVIEHATEPFFSTKKPGEGTGLGLSMIYGFCKQSGGHMSIYSEVGVGTTVRLYLPRSHDGAPAAAAEPVEAVRMPGGTESILIVDDNVELRRVTVFQLKGRGYKVHEAETGPAALAIMDAGERFDLLFTDIGLPDGMTGHELAALARQKQPWLKVLYTTGYGVLSTRKGDPHEKPEHLLRKPYRSRELVMKIRQALDGVI